jgi:hypothetical protein
MAQMTSKVAFTTINEILVYNEWFGSDRFPCIVPLGVPGSPTFLLSIANCEVGEGDFNLLACAKTALDLSTKLT